MAKPIRKRRKIKKEAYESPKTEKIRISDEYKLSATPPGGSGATCA